MENSSVVLLLYTIWYFDPGVKFLSQYFEPHHGKLNPLIFTKRWDSKYHGQGCQNTMGRGFNIPWVGGLMYHGYEGLIYHGCRVRYLMDRGFDIPWVGVFKYQLQYNSLLAQLTPNIGSKATNKQKMDQTHTQTTIIIHKQTKKGCFTI